MKLPNLELYSEWLAVTHENETYNDTIQITEAPSYKTISFQWTSVFLESQKQQKDYVDISSYIKYLLLEIRS